MALQAQGIVHIVRSEHTEGFVAVSKTLASIGQLKNSTKNMLIRDVRGAGADFLRSFLHFGASDLQVW